MFSCNRINVNLVKKDVFHTCDDFIPGVDTKDVVKLRKEKHLYLDMSVSGSPLLKGILEASKEDHTIYIHEDAYILVDSAPEAIGFAVDSSAISSAGLSSTWDSTLEAFSRDLIPRTPPFFSTPCSSSVIKEDWETGKTGRAHEWSTTSSDGLLSSTDSTLKAISRDLIPRTPQSSSTPFSLDLEKTSSDGLLSTLISSLSTTSSGLSVTSPSLTRSLSSSHRPVRNFHVRRDRENAKNMITFMCERSSSEQLLVRRMNDKFKELMSEASDESPEYNESITTNAASDHSVLIPNFSGLRNAAIFQPKFSPSTYFRSPLDPSRSSPRSKPHPNLSPEWMCMRASRKSLEMLGDVKSAAIKEGIRVTGFVSCAIGCPCEGKVLPAHLAQITKLLLRFGCAEAGDFINIRLTSTPTDGTAVPSENANDMTLVDIHIPVQKGICVGNTSIGESNGVPHLPSKDNTGEEADVVIYKF
ncbi:unnamed protein product [Caenorhabditis auriculariae]|uniref:Uncharacterized protein n=1 Tax=Caenorhabditis auriculariae TaxID=2777116 RepID=A0A8S1GWF3_9PELO|nr:unnamed protein product [Caenorhabditis auriculariae]